MALRASCDLKVAYDSSKRVCASQRLVGPQRPRLCGWMAHLGAVRNVALLVSILLCSPVARSQSARFTFDPYSSGPVYTTLAEATAALLAYASSQQPWGAYLAPWYSLDWYGERAVAYRVPPYKPDGYYNTPYVQPAQPTPTAACQRGAVSIGGTLSNVRFIPRPGNYGGGQGQWWCDLQIPNWGPYSFPLYPSCNTPFIAINNDDPQGEYMCGGGSGTVYASDLGPERQDECPAEGNPIFPSSAQKVEYDTDYDNGRLLRFQRFYGSQRVGLGPSAAVTHSFNPHLPNGSSSGTNYRADGTILRMGRNYSTGQWTSSSADSPYTITATGTYPYQSLNIVSFFEPTAEQYDSTGRLAWRSYAHGVVHRLSYADGFGGYLPGGPVCVLPSGVSPPTQFAPAGALQCVTDPFGRQLNFFVDSRFRIIKLVDPSGQSIQYFYDEASSYVAPGSQPGNNLTSVQFPDGYVRRYHYNEPSYTANAKLANALTGVSELIPPASQFSRFSIFTYDAQGRARTTERAGGTYRHSMAYGTATGQVSVTDPLGTVRTHTFNTMLGVSRRISTQQPAGAGSSACSDTRTYDSQANVTSRVDFNGNKICYANNAARRLEIKRVEGLPAAADCATALANAPAGARVITTEWHPYWRLQIRIAEPKLITTLSYNDNGANCAPADALVDGRRIAVVCSRSEQTTTDESGALAFTATATGSPRVKSYTYGSYGRVLSETDPNNRITRYSYHPDNDPNLGKRGNVASITNAANHVQFITDYNAQGQPTRIVDANGVVTVLAYDSRLRLTNHTSGSEATIYRYDSRGLLQDVTLPDGVKLTYSHDAAHRLASIADQEGNRIDYTLDSMGNRTAEQMKDSGGVLVKNIARVFDALNRVKQVTGAVQ